MEMIFRHVLLKKRIETHASIADTANARHMFATDEDAKDDFTRARI